MRLIHRTLIAFLFLFFLHSSVDGQQGGFSRRTNPLNTDQQQPARLSRREQLIRIANQRTAERMKRIEERRSNRRRNGIPNNIPTIITPRDSIDSQLNTPVRLSARPDTPNIVPNNVRQPIAVKQVPRSPPLLPRESSVNSAPIRLQPNQQRQPVIQPPPRQVPAAPQQNLIRQLPNLAPQIKEILTVAGLGDKGGGLGGVGSNLPNIAAQIPDNTQGLTQLLAGFSQNPSTILGGGGFQPQSPLLPRQPSATQFGGAFGNTGPSFGSPGFGSPGFNNLPNNQPPLPARPSAGGALMDVFGAIARRSGLQEVISNLNNGGKGYEFQVPGLDALIEGGAPPVPGFPRIPGIPLFPGGLPRDTTGKVDLTGLAAQIGQRFTGGASLSDYLPPDRLQKFADNVTNSLLPTTADLELDKFMGRWFEGIYSPRSSNQRCVVHHYGGLSKNAKSATFTALKIYREGSEFGQVRYSIGYAFRGGHRQGMLQMHSSEARDPAPFWVYKLGPVVNGTFGKPRYEYAIVSNWVRYPVTVLVRDPDSFQEKYHIEIIRWLEDNGFVNDFIRAFNLLEQASYKECQYAQSTFEAFG